MNIFKRLIYSLRILGMCKCVEPTYTVIDNTLACSNCNKPVKWEARSNVRRN